MNATPSIPRPQHEVVLKPFSGWPALTIVLLGFVATITALIAGISQESLPTPCRPSFR